MSSIIAFAGSRRIAGGDPIDVALEIKHRLDGGEDEPILVFDAATSRTVELDLRGSEAEIRARLTSQQLPDPQPIPSRGRPKLGVIAREVTLLPRQWAWLSAQRGGASAVLRRLVNSAQRDGGGSGTQQQAQEALYRFITVMAGDAAGYEESVRALFAGDEKGFMLRIAPWPQDVRAHALELAGEAFAGGVSLLARFIPIDRLAAVKAALSAVIGTAELTRVKHLTTGASGASVLMLDAGVHRCVLRLDGPADALRDSARHYACHAIAAQASVAPRLLYSDAPARISIASFLEDSAIEARDERLTALAQSLRKLHAAPLFPPLMPFLDAMERLLADFATTDVAPGEFSTRLNSLFGPIRAIYRPPASDIVSSHNDLNPGNIRFSESRVVFLDWETAFAADRYVDLAAVVNFFGRGEAHRVLLLSEYFGRAPEPGELARLELMRQVSRLFYAVMLLMVARRSDPDFRLPATAVDRAPRSQSQMSPLSPITSPMTASSRVELACSFLAEALAAPETLAFRRALRQVSREQPY